MPRASEHTNTLQAVSHDPGAHNEKQTGRGRSAKRPRSRLKFQTFPTVVELLNLEGEYIRYST